MSLFKVYAKVYVPMLVAYHVDIPSDDFVESMAIERIRQGKKVNQISADYDGSLPMGDIKVILNSPVDVKQVRAEAKSAREMAKIIKAEKDAEKKEEKKAQKRMTLKEKK